MKTTSAGLLMYRITTTSSLEVLLVHPGGPFWAKKDEGAWTIPKGEACDGENLLQTAIREFSEETGLHPAEPFIDLGSVTQKSGKIVYAWAFAGNCDATTIRSNTFSMEWPPKSGQMREFPEIDKAVFFDMSTAESKINPAQVLLLKRLADTLSGKLS